ncbi:MAG TPA: 50S ribosomal protein L17 [Candidatus Azoamicus sp. OHIO2]
MRHRKSGKKLNRTSSHRKSMFYNMSRSLIKYETIITTLPKAKELRRFIEPLITLSKRNNLANKRAVLEKIKDKKILKKLFLVLGQRYINRSGGYTRIYKYQYRRGDAATMAVIELINKN